jgi:hypothetical protein
LRLLEDFIASSRHGTTRVCWLFDLEIEWIQMAGVPRRGGPVGADAIFAGFREPSAVCGAIVERYLDAANSWWRWASTR